VATVLDRIGTGEVFRLWYERSGQVSYIELKN
jgi:hypothetical protein